MLKSPNFAADTVSPYFENRLSEREQTKWRPLFDVLRTWIVFKDPPDHARLRGLMRGAFTPRVVEAIRPAVQRMASTLLPAGEGRHEVNLIEEFAFPLPAWVISSMVGVHQEDLWLVSEWSKDIVEVAQGSLGSGDRRQRAQTAMLEFREYLRPIVEDRRRNPRDNDLLTELITAETESHQLTVDELLGGAILLLVAGHETTQNLLANCVIALARNPEQYRRLKEDRSLVRGTVEETLRFDGPVKSLLRVAVDEVQIGAVTVAKGDRVLISVAGANRDPRKFNDPDFFDVGRDASAQLTFGQGIHYCLGAPLARLETQEALNLILDRYRSVRLLTDRIEYDPKVIARTPLSVPVEFTS
ncbi:cytochrome P450 [Pseudonocardia oroxyli]|uniref:cytochrome P450 n=1 Tax=Pseudonocardia oroxyli TaxID=366584 RepID=UPI0015A0EEAC|nr:cytochrome P450 [Pseudonocardia oroxyli]